MSKRGNKKNNRLVNLLNLTLLNLYLSQKYELFNIYVGTSSSVRIFLQFEIQANSPKFSLKPYMLIFTRGANIVEDAV